MDDADARLRRGLLPELLGYRLRRAQVAVFQDFSATVREGDLTPGQVGVLILIHANPGLSQTELGQAMGVDRSTVVAVIDRLEKRDLVKRRPVPTDRRANALHLTAAGNALLGRVLTQIRTHEDRIAQRLSAAERDELVRLLGKLAGDED